MSDAIDNFLDRFFNEMAGTGATGRRSLSEVEDHLRAAQATLVSGGMTEIRAADHAVERFGDPESLARDELTVHRDVRGLARQLISGAWVLSAVGLIAIGISGLVAEAMGRLWGAGFVSGDTNGVTYTQARCADYLEYFPGHSCAQAAALHHWGEVVQYRAAAGVLGLIALGVFALARRGPMAGARWAPPRGPIALVGAALFALAAIALGGSSVAELALGGTRGVGDYLSAGVVAGLAALLVATYGYRVRASSN